MIKYYLSVLLCFVALQVNADVPAPVLPALFEVTGVSSDDTLNVRAMPVAGSEIIGELDYGAEYVEVVALSATGAWGRVNAIEQNGWVSMRYLQRMTNPMTANGLPFGLRCFGTEPFWMMNFEGQELVLSDPNVSNEPNLHPITDMSPAAEFADVAQTGILFRWTRDGLPITSRILPGQCNDGMSERAFGLHYVDNASWYGCCSLAE